MQADFQVRLVRANASLYTGSISLRELSKKYVLILSTILRRCKRGGVRVAKFPLERSPKKYQTPVIWAWSNLFSPLREETFLTGSDVWHIFLAY